MSKTRTSLVCDLKQEVDDVGTIDIACITSQMQLGSQTAVGDFDTAHRIAGAGIKLEPGSKCEAAQGGNGVKTVPKSHF